MTTWILLRGLARESGHWGGFIDTFGHAVPCTRIVALDLPGCGALHAQASPSRVPGIVAHLRAQLQARRVAPPYHLFALSLGAMAAVAWSHARPHEVAAQVLVNTSLRPFSPFWRRLRPANYATLLRLALPGATPEARERAVLRMTTHLTDDAVLASWLALQAAHPVSRANTLRQLLAAARYRAPREPPLVPTLLLASTHDALVSPACSQALAREWRCPLQLHPRAGHDLPLDDAAWVAQRVRQWTAASGIAPTGTPP